MITIDHFIDEIDSLADFARSCEYRDEVNPEDNVTYPLICKDIPGYLSVKVINTLSDKFKKPENPIMFLRASPSGVRVPNPVHHDLSMGRYSLMLYLETNDAGGTGFVRHNLTGISYAPQMESLAKLLKSDAANLDRWTIYHAINMVANRALIFDAGNMHIALPSGGYGKNKTDQRVVFTCFFS